MPKRSKDKKNPILISGELVKLCLRGGLLGVNPKSSTSVRNGNVYDRRECVYVK